MSHPNHHHPLPPPLNLRLVAEQFQAQAQVQAQTQEQPLSASAATAAFFSNHSATAAAGHTSSPLHSPAAAHFFSPPPHQSSFAAAPAVNTQSQCLSAGPGPHPHLHQHTYPPPSLPYPPPTPTTTTGHHSLPHSPLVPSHPGHTAAHPLHASNAQYHSFHLPQSNHSHLNYHHHSKAHHHTHPYLPTPTASAIDTASVGASPPSPSLSVHSAPGLPSSSSAYSPMSYGPPTSLFASHHGLGTAGPASPLPPLSAPGPLAGPHHAAGSLTAPVSTVSSPASSFAGYAYAQMANGSGGMLDSDEFDSSSGEGEGMRTTGPSPSKSNNTTVLVEDKRGHATCQADDDVEEGEIRSVAQEPLDVDMGSASVSMASASAMSVSMTSATVMSVKSQQLAHMQQQAHSQVGANAAASQQQQLPESRTPSQAARDLVAAVAELHHQQQQQVAVAVESSQQQQQPLSAAQQQPSASSATSSAADGKRYRLEDFELLETLGTGTFGRVHLTRLHGTSQYFAMKVLKKTEVVRLKQVEHINSEKAILSRIYHPFIVNLFCTFQDSINLYMLLEYVPGGELFSHLRRAGKFHNDVARFYAAEIISAIDYMHKRDIIYRDLKPENLLLDARGHIKIADFGFAKIVEDRTWTLCGTPEYLAPEIIQGFGHGRAVDWWALGILIFEMLCGYPPFFDDSAYGIYEKILAGRIHFPSHVDPAAKDLIKRLLTADTTRRLGNLRGAAEDVKGHAWFKGVDWDAVMAKRINAPLVPRMASAGDTSNFEKYPEPEPEVNVSTADPYRYLFLSF